MLALFDVFHDFLSEDGSGLPPLRMGQGKIFGLRVFSATIAGCYEPRPHKINSA
jgi:hypothetical protein